MFRFAVEPIATYNEIQSVSQLIDFECFSNFHFAITKDNCGHIFRLCGSCCRFSKHPWWQGDKFVCLPVKLLMFGVTPQWTNVPFRGSTDTPSLFMSQKPGYAPG